MKAQRNVSSKLIYKFGLLLLDFLIVLLCAFVHNQRAYIVPGFFVVLIMASIAQWKLKRNVRNEIIFQKNLFALPTAAERLLIANILHVNRVHNLNMHLVH